jgi:hypothetical protein
MQCSGLGSLSPSGRAGVFKTMCSNIVLHVVDDDALPVVKALANRGSLGQLALKSIDKLLCQTFPLLGMSTHTPLPSAAPRVEHAAFATLLKPKSSHAAADGPWDAGVALSSRHTQQGMQHLSFKLGFFTGSISTVSATGSANVARS